ncbi:MAG: hypothetical protein AAF371_16775 [Pseudomonadota bacterium]
MYANDSFFTLSQTAAAGLAVLSTLLAIGLIFAVRLFSKTASRARRAALGMAFWWVFLWLSPQIFYGYYWLVIPGLPVQSVIGWPPGPVAIIDLLSFTGPATLPAHARGALGWACLAAALWPCRGRRGRG